MKFFLRSAIILCLSHACFAHSHVECTDYNTDTAVCNGYARYYAANKKGYEGSAESKDRNYIVAAGTQTCPAPQGDQEYTDKYPMARVAPGQTVTVYWPPRGHTQQPSSDVWINCSPTAGAKNPTLESETERIATMPYDNCTGDDISWAVCTGSFQIPTLWQPGETRTCQWVWTLNGGQTYVDCFEYQVVALDSSTATTPNLPALPKQQENNGLKQRDPSGHAHLHGPSIPSKTAIQTKNIADGPQVTDLCKHIIELCQTNFNPTCEHVLSECSKLNKGSAGTATNLISSLQVTPV